MSYQWIKAYKFERKYTKYTRLQSIVRMIREYITDRRWRDHFRPKATKDLTNNRSSGNITTRRVA